MEIKMASWFGNLPSNTIAGRADAGQDMPSISHINAPVYTIDISGGTVVMGASGPYHTNDTYKKKRMDLKTGEKIPVDIWAMMYNNGVIDD